MKNAINQWNWTAIGTCVIAAFTIAIAVVGFLQWHTFGDQLNVMQMQLGEMRSQSKLSEQTFTATQRPWISVRVSIGPRGLFFDDNGANLNLMYSLKNSGPTPAIALHVEGGPWIGIQPNDPLRELEKTCQKAKIQKTDPKMVGFTVQPGETLTLNWTYSFAGKPLIAKIIKEKNGITLPWIIGCGDYLFTFGAPHHHQTRFIYILNHPLSQGGTGGIVVTEGNKAAETLSLMPWIEASSFLAD